MEELLSWILVRTSRILDWLLVFAAVFGLVFLCQFMVNFYKEPEEKDHDDDSA
ncbi:MAG: hypothetical protein ABFS19_06675 [Thermodesulfobacteriota bacterium]